MMIYEPQGRALEYSLLALNHYVGCQHGCTYCYARSICEQTGSRFDEPRIRPGVVEHVRREAGKLAGTDRRVLLSFLSDPYQSYNETHLITRRVLEVLREHDVPFQVLTKGGTRACRDYELYGPRDAVAATLTFVDDRASRKYEPHAALPGDRMLALQIAHRAGIETWASLEPVVDPEQSLQLIDLTHEYVSLYKIGVLNHDARARLIDWRAFGEAAIARCERYGVRYYVKTDLAKHLDGISYTSEDTRRVKRATPMPTTTQHKAASQQMLVLA